MPTDISTLKSLLENEYPKRKLKLFIQKQVATKLNYILKDPVEALRSE